MAGLDAIKALRPTVGLMLRRDGSGLPWGGRRDAKVHIALGVMLASVPAAANVHDAYRCGIADSMYNDPEIWELSTVRIGSARADDRQRDQLLITKLEMSGVLPYILRIRRRCKMARSPTRSTRLEARIAPDALAVVKRAAEIQGRSVSDFVVAAAQEAAQKTIEETQLVRLSLEDQIAFAEAITTPPEPNDALHRAKDAHRRLLLETR